MNKDYLIEQLRDMGLKKDDRLMLHSSMKAIGDVDGGADTVIDALLEYLSEGMLMAPTHTWKQMSEQYNIFDPKTEASCVGIITNLLMKRDGAYRSKHPTHSIVAIGNGAEDYVLGEERFNTPCDPKGCFGRLRDIGAKILLAGVTHAKNTYIHSIEESFDIRERLTEKPVKFYVKLEAGEQREVLIHRHYNETTAHISESFDKLKEYYYETGAAKKVMFGNAESILCDAAKLYDVTGRILREKPDYFIEYVKK